MTGKEIHQPMRTCIGCRNRTSKAGLVRLVLCDGMVKVDRKQKLPGRGAWLCLDKNCLDQANRRHAFGRAFRQQIAALVDDSLLQEASAGCITQGTGGTSGQPIGGSATLRKQNAELSEGHDV